MYIHVILLLLNCIKLNILNYIVRNLEKEGEEGGNFFEK